MSSSGAGAARISVSRSRVASTTARLDASACLRIVQVGRAAAVDVHDVVLHREASRATLATSPISTGTLFTTFIGIWLNWSTVGGLEFIMTL